MPAPHMSGTRSRSTLNTLDACERFLPSRIPSTTFLTKHPTCSQFVHSTARLGQTDLTPPELNQVVKSKKSRSRSSIQLCWQGFIWNYRKGLEARSGRQMARHASRRRRGQTGPRIADAHRAYPPTGLTLRHPTAAAHQRNRDDRRLRRSTPQKDGYGMELRLGYKQAGAGAMQADWRDCDISDLCRLQRRFDITEAMRKSSDIPVY